MVSRRVTTLYVVSKTNIAEYRHVGGRSPLHAGVRKVPVSVIIFLGIDIRVHPRRVYIAADVYRRIPNLTVNFEKVKKI